MDSYNEMLVLDESDMNARGEQLYNDNGTLELSEMKITDFRIGSNHIYKSSVIIYKSKVTTDIKVLKNRFGKDD